MKNFKKPFSVADGRIVDADGTEVRLWGTNYYLPFNHNYVNIDEIGKDHYKAINRDIADFKRMGIDVIRMHVYEREITDIYGNVIENDHLRVMDYLIEQLDQAGIHVMMTPITWFNTVVNQKSVTDYYVIWSTEKMDAFGFSNFYPNHAMVWHDTALKCEENYLRQFFSRRNVFSHKTLAEYDNVVIVEVSNETAYPNPDLIKGLRKERENRTVNPYKDEEFKLIDKYENYISERRLDDNEKNMWEFCAYCLKRYLDRMFGIVDEYFGDTVLKSQIFYGTTEPSIYKCIKESRVNCISVEGYIGRADGTNNEHTDFLEELQRLSEKYKYLLPMKKGFIAYEYDAQSSLLGLPYGGFGYTFASMGVQITIHFTYTPLDVAEYNPGWLIHFMNLRHTPEKAAAFIAGGAIFRKTKYEAPIFESNEAWENDCFIIDTKTGNVIYSDENSFIHSKPTDMTTSFQPDTIVGIGNCQFAESNGNGVYFLRRKNEGIIELDIMPNQFYTSDPTRGKLYSKYMKNMANRYIDVNREGVVSRLKENGSVFTLKIPGFEKYIVYRMENGFDVEVGDQSFFRADPGSYTIKKV